MPTIEELQDAAASAYRCSASCLGNIQEDGDKYGDVSREASQFLAGMLATCTAAICERLEALANSMDTLTDAVTGLDFPGEDLDVHSEENPTESEAFKISPCVCGGPGELIYEESEGRGTPGYFVRCKNACACSTPSQTHQLKIQTVASWNQKAPR